MFFASLLQHGGSGGQARHVIRHADALLCDGRLPEGVAVATCRHPGQKAPRHYGQTIAPAHARMCNCAEQQLLGAGPIDWFGLSRHTLSVRSSSYPAPRLEPRTIARTSPG